MARKRKILVATAEEPQKENVPAGKSGGKKYKNDLFNDAKAQAVGKVVLDAQKNASLHEKCIKQLHTMYEEVGHDTFIKVLIHMVQVSMMKPIDNKPTNCILDFCAKLFVSFEQDNKSDSTHPVVCDAFKWLLETTSIDSLIRFRMCQFVNTFFNAFGDEAQMDNDIWDNIQKIMLERLRDTNMNVRQQAVFALQRLQDPSNPEDKVIKAYIFHMETDPSEKVRRAVIASIAKNQRIMPHLIGRLWDVEESVRRLVYLQFAKYPVTNFKVVQRIQILDQGLNEMSALAKKCVTNILIPSWFQAYNGDYLRFINALKIDASVSDLEQFKKISVNALQEIFRQKELSDYVNVLNLSKQEETLKCIQLENVNNSIELLILWQAIIKFLTDTEIHDVDTVLPDMSVIAEFLKNFIETNYKNVENDEDKLMQIYFQFEVFMLLEIINGYDFDDEIGRQVLQPILLDTLQKVSLEAPSIKIICEILEKLISNSDQRLDMISNVIKSIIDPAFTFNFDETNKIIDEYLQTSPNFALMTEISAVKFALLDSIEKRDIAKQRNNHAEALQHQTDIETKQEEYKILIKPILESSKESSVISLAETLYSRRRLSPETISKCLKICFHMVALRSVKQLTPSVVDLYKKFVCNYLESSETGYRMLALKVATTYSMLYDTLAHDVYKTLGKQLVSTHSVKILQTAILGIFELLDFYGFEKFNIETSNNRTKKSGRTLYNTNADDTEDEDTIEQSDLISSLLSLLDKCSDDHIVLATVLGFCRLIIHKWLTSADIVAKLLLKFFNPVTSDDITQTLGSFFKELISRRQQELLQEALFPTLRQIIDAPPESPLRDVNTKKLIQFVVNSTRPEFSPPGLNIHNTIALSFFNIVKDDGDSETNNELIKLLSGELHTLQIGDDRNLRDDFKQCVDELMKDFKDVKVAKSLMKFKEMLEEKNTRNTIPNETVSDDEEVSVSGKDDGVFKVPPAKEKPNDTFIPPINESEESVSNDLTEEESNVSNNTEKTPKVFDASVEASDVESETSSNINSPLPEFELPSTQDRSKDESFFVTSTQVNITASSLSLDESNVVKRGIETRRGKRDHPPNSPSVASPARKVEKRGSISSSASSSQETTKSGTRDATRKALAKEVQSNTTMTRTKSKTAVVPAPLLKATSARVIPEASTSSVTNKTKKTPAANPASKQLSKTLTDTRSTSLPKRIPKPTEKAKAAAELVKNKLKSPTKSAATAKTSVTESPQRLSVVTSAPRTPVTPRSRANTRNAGQTPEVIPQTPESKTGTPKTPKTAPSTSKPITRTPRSARGIIDSPDVIPGSPLGLIGLRSLTKKNLRSRSATKK